MLRDYVAPLILLLTILQLSSTDSTHSEPDVASIHMTSHLRHFEPLTYDALKVTRTKRFTEGVLQIAFSAFDRVFELELRRGSRTLASSIHKTTPGTEHEEPVDISHIYKGHLKGYPRSVVRGSVIDGVFSGFIRDESGQKFFIEKSETLHNTEQLFHSLIYREQDIIISSRTQKSKLHPDDSHCGLADAMVKSWIENIRPADLQSVSPSSDDDSFSSVSTKDTVIENGRNSGAPSRDSLPSSATIEKKDITKPNELLLYSKSFLAMEETYKNSSKNVFTPRLVSDQNFLVNIHTFPGVDTDSNTLASFDGKNRSLKNVCTEVENVLFDDMKNAPKAKRVTENIKNSNGKRLKDITLAQPEFIYDKQSKQKLIQERVANKPVERRKRKVQGDVMICSLFMRSDGSVWDYMTKSTSSGGLGYKDVRAKQEIVALFDLLVSGAQDIFDKTVLKTDDLGPYTGITFAIYGIEINTTLSCATNAKETNPFCPSNIDVSSMLSLNSLRNHNDYCLSFLITYRNFGDGTLGLAFVGYPDKIPGGACERYRPIRDQTSVMSRSLNTGVITLNNYGRRVTSAVSIITMTHEIGHSFGAKHDELGTDCAPASNSKKKDPKGNYLMYPKATTGDQPNNKKFSPCSIVSMTQLVDAILYENNGKYNCFMKIELTDAELGGEGASAALASSYCGNRRVEAGEQCDCGLTEECLLGDFRDECCHPQNDTQYRCTLRSSAQCSPSQGTCCKNTCHLASETEYVSCSSETECTYESFCDGLSAQCPSPYWKQDYTACNRRTQVCINGTCSQSICVVIGWTSCTPDQSTAADDDYGSSRLCQLSCRNPITSQCINTGDQLALDQPENEPLKGLLVKQKVRLEPAPPTLYVAIVPDDEPIGLFLPPGTPCNEGLGYCDMFHRCSSVDQEGPLQHVMNAFLGGEKNTNSLAAWIAKYWWALLLVGIGFILVAIVIARVFSVNTPGSLPSTSPEKSNSYHSSMESSNQDSIPGLTNSGIVWKGQRAGFMTSTEIKRPISSNSYYWTAVEKPRRAPNRGTASFLGSLNFSPTFLSFSPPEDSPIMITKTFSINFSEEGDAAPLQYHRNQQPRGEADKVDNNEPNSSLSDNGGQQNWSASDSSSTPNASKVPPSNNPKIQETLSKNAANQQDVDKETIAPFQRIQIEDLRGNEPNDIQNKNNSKEVINNLFKEIQFRGLKQKYDDHVNNALPGVEYNRTAL